MFSLSRSNKNPIIKPDAQVEWKAYATFNCSPARYGKKKYLLYRAMSRPKRFESSYFSMSTIVRAEETERGIRNHTPFIVPEEEWERFGCEDPRVSRIEGMNYIFYTALGSYPFRGDHIRVAVALTKDFTKIEKRYLVTPFNAKAMSLFPEKIQGKYVALFAPYTDDGKISKISVARFEKIEDMWNEGYWKTWNDTIENHRIHIPCGPGEQVEVGAPPIKTDYGWLLIYSHIQNYFSDSKIFGIQAVLLDLKNPQKILAQTRGHFLVPEERYEKEGNVHDITFPSGAELKGDVLTVYYGGADTVVAQAHLSLKGLLASMKFVGSMPGELDALYERRVFIRDFKQPLLLPRPDHAWESFAVFNPAAILFGNTTHILYRAMSKDNTSVVGYAQSHDMKRIRVRDITPAYIPRLPFEAKNIPGGNSGCEDPRITLIGDILYMTYTAYNGTDLPCIALTSITKKDFLAGLWKWTLPVKISADGVDDKDGMLFPEKVQGKYVLIHRVNHCVCFDYSSTLDFKNRNEFKNINILSPRWGMWDSKKVGGAMPPFKLKQGWLMLYHGIGEDGHYRVGAALLDLKNIEKVIARSTYPLFEPEMPYEREGIIPNVVFPCGAVIHKGRLHIYYGGADTVVNVASMELKDILNSLS